MQFSVEEYEGLQIERSDFQSEDVTLAGYKHSKENQAVKGVIVIAHGLGGGRKIIMWSDRTLKALLENLLAEKVDNIYQFSWFFDKLYDRLSYLDVWVKSPWMVFDMFIIDKSTS